MRKNILFVFPHTSEWAIDNSFWWIIFYGSVVKHIQKKNPNNKNYFKLIYVFLKTGIGECKKLSITLLIVSMCAVYGRPSKVWLKRLSYLCFIFFFWAHLQYFFQNKCTIIKFLHHKQRHKYAWFMKYVHSKHDFLTQRLWVNFNCTLYDDFSKYILKSLNIFHLRMFGVTFGVLMCRLENSKHNDTSPL